MSKRLSLTLRIILPVILLTSIAAFAGVAYIHERMNQEALREARNISRILLERNMATHAYFGGMLKPKVFSAIENLPGEAPFAPEWMSSTYAVREIDKLFQARYRGLRYYYKECAINARSPENEADPLEASVLSRMKEDPTFDEWADRRELDGKPYYVYMLRGESMEGGCLRCHSEPDEAPRGLVEIYGPERSFHREAGELVSAVSIRIPMSETLASMRAVAWDIGVALVVALVVLAVGLWGLMHHAVVSPLGKMAQSATRISTAPGHLGEEEMPAFTGSAEVASLASALTTMSRNIGAYQRNLQSMVDGRTEELRRSEAAARTERDRFMTLFEQSADTIFLLRPDGDLPPRIVDVNAAGLALHRLEKADLIGKPISVIDSAAAGVAGEERRSRLAADGEADFEVEHQTSDGRVLTVDVRAKRIELGGEPFILSVERDISERRRMEARLRESKKMEALGTLAGGIAHDFNNMLSAIIGYTEIVRERARPGSEDVEDLAEVLGAARRAKELVEQVLAYARKASETRKTLDPVELARGVVEDFHAGGAKQVDFAFEAPGPIGAITADGGRLEDVLRSLVENAVQALADGVGEVRVHLAEIDCGRAGGRCPEELAPGRYVVFSIADNGVGMEPATLEKVFDPFFTTSPLGEKKGMGLSVADGVVKSHGGAIDIESRPGRGTTVRLFLPLAATKAA